MSNLPTEIIEIIHSDDPKHIKLARILKYITATQSIDSRDYYILGSYALREHRTISDLDINMDPVAFDQLPKDLGIIELYNNQIRWFLDMTPEYNKVDPAATDFSIEAFRKCDGEGYPSADYSLRTLTVNNSLDTDNFGHQFMGLETLLKWKKEMKRTKDAADIALIESLLRKTGSSESSMLPKFTGGCQLSHLMLGLMILFLLIMIFIEHVSHYAVTVYDHICLHLNL